MQVGHLTDRLPWMGVYCTCNNGLLIFSMTLRVLREAEPIEDSGPSCAFTDYCFQRLPCACEARAVNRGLSGKEMGKGCSIGRLGSNG